MNEEIREILSRLLSEESEHLSNLTPEDLVALDEQLLAAVAQAREARDVALVRDLVTAIQAVRAEADTRAEADEAADSEISEILSEVQTPDADADTGEGDEPTEDGQAAEAAETEQPEIQAEAATETTEAEAPAEQQVAVAASGRPPLRPVIERLAARLPATPAPTAVTASSGTPSHDTPVKVVAHADVIGYSAGSEVPIDQAGHVVAEKMWALREARGPAAYPILQFQIDYPQDRQLEPGDTKGNTEKVNAVVSSAAIMARIREAGGLEAINLANIRHANDQFGMRNEITDAQVSLVAAGGLCAPVDASYDLQTVAVADRPVRDSFPRFQARRGGIRFITPPRLAQLEPGVGTVTEAQDAAGTTKTCVVIDCGAEVEVVVNAVYLCLEVGTFSRLSFPEQFQAWHTLGLAQHAREAEGNLLNAMSANSTATTDGQNFGAARDLAEAYARAAASFRNSRRMRPGDPLQIYLPAWALAMMKADLLRQMPGDNTLAVTDGVIAAMFANHNLSVTFYLDERPGAGQLFAEQGVAPLIGWPATVEGYLTHPGAFTFLDMGTLDFGTEIRDTTMIEQNNMRAFMETFENLAFQGVGSLRVRSEVCVSGQASALEDYVCPGDGS